MYTSVSERQFTEKGSNGEVEKAKEWNNLNAPQCGFTLTPCNKKYMDHIVYELDGRSPIPIEMWELFTIPQLNDITDGRLRAKVYKEIFTGTLSNGFDYDEIPTLSFSIKRLHKDFSDDEKALFRIVQLDEHFVSLLRARDTTLYDLFIGLEESGIFDYYFRCQDYRQENLKELNARASALIEALKPLFKKQWELMLRHYLIEQGSTFENDYFEYDPFDNSFDYNDINLNVISAFIKNHNVYLFIKNK